MKGGRHSAALCFLRKLEKTDFLSTLFQRRPPKISTNQLRKAYALFLLSCRK